MPKINNILKQIFIILSLTIITAIICLEIGLRVLTTKSVDGDVSFSNLQLRPLSIPENSVTELLETYAENTSEAFFISDDRVGWTFAPNMNTPISTNSLGMRDNLEYALEASDDVLRIAIFGDSFIASAEVGDEETLTVLLEAELEARGISAEVMNFGVSGYGMDQAYLRWATVGREFEPDIVIMGFQPENISRNVSVFRSFLCDCGIPFSKPRFTLNEAGSLDLINSPTFPLDDIPVILANFDEHPISTYEWHYNERYQPTLWDISYIWRMIEAYQYTKTFAREVFVPPLTIEDERSQVAIGILEEFQAEATADGQAFVVLHIPPIQMVADYLSDDGLQYQFLLNEIETKMPVIHAETLFNNVDDNDWMPLGHYSPHALHRIANYTADWVTEWIEENES